ncbi:reprolysin-like metallopeptidase [Chryseobacterium gleum]|uniref:reprolysin-like metallopeptidase n=1 Tax=Chryseobacterium gleum TaxID=250 RepID=UPI00103B7A5E|nr:zinc-dependent metalloprotease family protein [Chryseobacterium gleum]MCD9617150.1 M12 family metallo-peptidase [Chryseobacterium gleum]QBJ86798.1 T9SS C-terminal target domain-containing protein [Chryseobacterium gleum]
MKRVFTALMFTFIGGAVFGQWTPTSFKKGDDNKRSTGFRVDQSNVRGNGYYKLDLNLLRSQLKNAQEMGANSTPVVISLPTMSGKIERFNVYSFPVVVKELADKYELGSYVGTSVEDPTKYLRFSIAPNDFQSMIIHGDKYEFIDPASADKTVYAVHPKTKKEKNGFLCSTEESPAAKKEIDALLKNGQSFTNQPTTFNKSSDKKYRTMRLAMSVTGEYTQYFMTLAGVPATATDDQKRAPALVAINNTLTRVNGVFEKDFALHLNLQNFPNVIYIDPATDPYAAAATGAQGAWNGQLQAALTANVGNENYDIGHLFGKSGGGGNAGCIGCVCINPTTTVPKGKGSGFTSPANGIPSGDSFDIDYVAHEMGHQLGANHTFSHNIEGSGVNMEPGSGSTIMGYAGITGPDTDIQPNSDAYFHKASIGQVQANLIAKTCDVETTITNNPPVINDLPTYTIPKGTAFALTGTATDPENDPMTYSWEEVDDATLSIDKYNLGNTTSGASFRSAAPSTSPTRYFPKFTSVMSGVLNNANNTWEAVSTKARTTKFALTVRDNNSVVSQQQSAFKVQTIVVGDNGPFRLANQYADVNTPTPIQWIVANTNAAPYNVANVKIDYTTDNGTTWTVLSASTPNDGTENFTFPSSLNGQTIKVRVSSIGNVFYAVGPVSIAPLSACSSAAPTNVAVSNITVSSASVSWMSYTGATYKVRYRKVGTTVWTEADTTVPSINLSNLIDGTTYEVQVALVCGTVVGTYSASVNFSTPAMTYCPASTADTSYEYIANVTLANVNNTSASSTYTNYTTNTALQINMTKGNVYPMSVTVGNPDAADYDTVAAFIDFNKDGVFSDSERVLNYPVTLTQPSTVVSGNVTIPADAVEGQPLRMRVVAFYVGAGTGNGNVGLSLPTDYICGDNFDYGEVEDYNVVITGNLATAETAVKNNGIQIYPNPVSDVLNITKVSDKATYKIYSAAGQLVDKGNINNGKVNVSALVKGGYVITIDDKGIEQFKSKFIKK